MELKENQLSLKQSLQKLDNVGEMEKEIKEAMDKAIQDKIQFKINLDEKRERVDILSEENKSLRTKLLDNEDKIKTIKKQMKNLQTTIEHHEDLQQKVQLLTNDLQFQQTQLALKNKDHEETKKTLTNLQRAMTA